MKTRLALIVAMIAMFAVQASYGQGDLTINLNASKPIYQALDLIGVGGLFHDPTGIVVTTPTRYWTKVFVFGNYIATLPPNSAINAEPKLSFQGRVTYPLFAELFDDSTCQRLVAITGIKRDVERNRTEFWNIGSDGQVVYPDNRVPMYNWYGQNSGIPSSDIGVRVRVRIPTLTLTTDNAVQIVNAKLLPMTLRLNGRLAQVLGPGEFYYNEITNNWTDATRVHLEAYWTDRGGVVGYADEWFVLTQNGPNTVQYIMSNMRPPALGQ